MSTSYLMMKDPAHDLSNTFVSLLQILSAMFGGLFLWLSIMVFNGQELMNSMLEMIDEPHHVSSEEAFVIGTVFFGLFLACLAAFFVLRYLRKVVKKETGSTNGVGI
ncbi:hypothetical protein KZP23_05690 [Echinicola marina]|uniref:hypothetical protein n=1 Tax=Echinicola marina TaxID=2859768 RepID=UPI001CF68884|nr:hypothetical protein [Echinicola marina]UCS94515.1 hypothetical protein KZP23_05690 [Echinicola marina]